MLIADAVTYQYGQLCVEVLSRNGGLIRRWRAGWEALRHKPTTQQAGSEAKVGIKTACSDPRRPLIFKVCRREIADVVVWWVSAIRIIRLQLPHPLLSAGSTGSRFKSHVAILNEPFVASLPAQTQRADGATRQHKQVPVTSPSSSLRKLFRKSCGINRVLVCKK
jgi:hypothetical protein